MAGHAPGLTLVSKMRACVRSTVALLLLAMASALASCGGTAVPAPSPSQGEAQPPTPTASASAPATTPTPRSPIVGAPAWVAVSVASGWRAPSSPRPVDGAALQNPPDIKAWLARMSASDKVGLIDRLDTQALLGEEVQVLAISGGWANVSIPGQPSPLDQRGYPVWMPVNQLTAVPPPASMRSLRVITPQATLRSADSTIEVSFGTELPLLRTIGAMDVVGVPGGGSMYIDALKVTSDPLPPTGASLVATARLFLGLPYLWGGTSGYGFDCSGFVHLVYRAHGIVVPRDADPQSKVGMAVSRASLQPGDLIFFASGGVAYHVAVYAGSGMIIDSPSPGFAVRTVRLDSLPILGDYAGARRVLQ